ncbi:ERMES complex subunit mmm1 [Globomyces sp. JEL0801]|nr:ERMES complex subunit mmm1 [Globomyces sp. JEL0801]
MISFEKVKTYLSEIVKLTKILNGNIDLNQQLNVDQVQLKADLALAKKRLRSMLYYHYKRTNQNHSYRHIKILPKPSKINGNVDDMMDNNPQPPFAAAVQLANGEFIKGFISGQVILCILIFFLLKVFLLRNSTETKLDLQRLKTQSFVLPKIVVEFVPQSTSDKGSLDTALSFFIMEDFILDFGVSSLLGHRTKVKDLPKLTSLITSTLRAVFVQELVYPARKTFKLPNGYSIFTPKTANTSSNFNEEARSSASSASV